MQTERLLSSVWKAASMAHVELPEFVSRDGRGDPDPYRHFDWMRSAMPVGPVVGPDGEGTAWFVTSYEHARACLADPRLSNERRNSATATEGEDEDEGDLLGKDPPQHTRLRKLVSPVLSSGAVARLRPRITEVCASLIDAFAGRGTADLVAEYAWPIPWAVVHEFLGIPESERMSASRCIDRFLVAGYQEQQRHGRPTPATDELMGYVRQLIAYKRRHRGDDLTTVMIDGFERGEVRSEAELEGMLYVLLGAGQVSTGPMIAAAALRLLEDPSHLAGLRAGETNWRLVVEESLRYDAPVQTSVSRYALTDLELGGVRIAKGDMVIVSLAAANRDPARFADAARFHAGPGRPSHLAFGHGIHLCVGAPLARLEGEICLRMLFDRLPSLRLAVPAGDTAWVLGPKLRSPREIPVLFDAQGAAPSRPQTRASHAPEAP
ncbi:cytochrome P450 [Micromonospora sp. NPDC047812]|uniref:cytochrome P450 family protein n=1 Tax=Micromonospora sp. NPDC047812 TaxID=3155742 RepID=UPI0034526472